MRKILVSLLAVSGSSAFAWDYTQFQAFDNQVSIGYGITQNTTTGYGGGANYVSTSNNVNLEGERLLNNGVWVDLNANMTFGQGSTSTTNGFQAQPVTNNYGLNGKVGYAFPFLGQHLLVTPYATAGLNNNGVAGTYGTGTQASGASQSTANQFYYTGGAGGRIEYRINRTIEVYADQNVAYNWDQTGYSNGMQPQNMYSYTSTLGAKFNIVKDFQLGVRGFYTGYQPDAGTTNPAGTGFAYPQAQSGLGGLVSIGLTY